MAPCSPTCSPNPSLPQATLAMAATNPNHAGGSGKVLSLDAPPFIPFSTGRTKSMRWDEISVSDYSDDEEPPTSRPRAAPSPPPRCPR